MEFMAYTGITLPYLLVAQAATAFNSDSGKGRKYQRNQFQTALNTTAI